MIRPRSIPTQVHQIPEPLPLTTEDTASFCFRNNRHTWLLRGPPQEVAPNGLSAPLWPGQVEDGVGKCMVLLEVPGKCSIISTKGLLKTQAIALIYIPKYRPGMQMNRR